MMNINIWRDPGAETSRQTGRHAVSQAGRQPARQPGTQEIYIYIYKNIDEFQLVHIASNGK